MSEQTKIIDVEPITETKLTDMELSEIKAFQENLQKTCFQFGQLTLSRIELDRSEGQLKAEFTNLQTTETEMYQNLFKKYGKGRVDLAKGVFVKD